MAREIDYDVPCINCNRTACDGVQCLEPDPEDAFLTEVWEDEYREWVETRRNDGA